MRSEVGGRRSDFPKKEPANWPAPFFIIQRYSTKSPQQQPESDPTGTYQIKYQSGYPHLLALKCLEVKISSITPVPCSSGTHCQKRRSIFVCKYAGTIRKNRICVVFTVFKRCGKCQYAILSLPSNILCPPTMSNYKITDNFLPFGNKIFMLPRGNIIETVKFPDISTGNNPVLFRNQSSY